MFVGRDVELKGLEAALAAAMGGEGALALISGEPGIGKSRLAEELSRRAAARGACVVWGRAWEGEGTPAYWPWLEILRALGDDARTAPVVERARGAAAELSALLDGRGMARDAYARFRLLDEIRGVLGTASSEVPLVLVLDDLHAADTPSLDLLAFVARGLRGMRALVLGTTRDERFVGRLEALAKVAREASPMPLVRLRAEDVARWVEADAPQLRERASELCDTAGGNPLFVSELIVAWRHDELERTPLGIRDAIRAHLARVPPAARRLLEVASVFGRDVPLAALRPFADSASAVDEVLGSSLLASTGDATLRFSHELLREHLYREVPDERRRELHLAVARHFAREPARAVSHALAAGDLSPTGEVVRLVLAVMREAMDRLAFEDAVALGERALAALRARLTPSDEASILVAVGEALIVAGRAEQGRASCARAADLAGDDASLLARAALGHASEVRLGRDEASIRLLRSAVAAGPPDERLAIQLLARLATAIIPPTPEEGDEPLRLARSALDRARELGDDETRLATSVAMFSTFPQEFALGERFALGSEILSLSRRVGQPARAAPLVFWQVATWLELGRLDGARQEVDFGREFFASLPPNLAWRGELLEAFLAAVEGRFDEAYVIARRVAATSTSPEAVHQACIHLMALPYLHGDDAAYAVDDARVARTLGSVPGGRIFLGIGDALAGRFDRVRDAIAHACELDLRGVPGAAALGWPVVKAGLAEHADQFYELARASAERSPLLFGPGITLGLADLLAGRLAALAGRPDLAATHFQRASVFAERLGAPPFVAAARRALSGAVAPSGSRSPEPDPEFSVTRRGALWCVAMHTQRGGPRELLLEDRRGVAYLAALVAAPFRELHVLELSGIDEASDAGPLLDDRAKRAYRERAESLRDTLAEAERNADLGAAERARTELDALANELRRATGLGGRDRRAGSATERARINVQRRLRDVVRRVTEGDDVLGRHLELSLKTGTFCRYAPAWERSFRAGERL